VYVLVFCVKGLCLLYFHHDKKGLNHPDTFSFAFVHMTFKSQRRNLTLLIKKCYGLYFGRKVGDQDKSKAPQYENITGTFVGIRSSLLSGLAGRLAT
jgi:hypothetical protein